MRAPRSILVDAARSSTFLPFLSDLMVQISAVSMRYR
jgi:hypothetical protein